jgi:hypothetical protein
MTAWREQSFWSKVGVWAWVIFVTTLSGYGGSTGLDAAPHGRKRVFSPGFVVLCFFVGVIELIALSYFYGRRE